MVDPLRRASVLVALGFAASTACGGISHRDVGDNESGAAGDDGSGGRGSGGKGGSTGGTGVDDGGASFTGGSGGAGGSITTGGVGADGGSFTAGGTFTGGNGAMGGNFTTGGAGGSVSTGGTVPVAGSSSAGAPSDPYAIRWQGDGTILPETNLFGIEGKLYFATDCASTTGSGLGCTQPDPNLVGPDGQPGWAVSDTVACARGVAPMVEADPVTGLPAYDRQWGALLGISLGQAGNPVFDAKAYGIVAFSVDVIGVAPPDVRVNFVTPETQGASHFITTFVPAPNRIYRFDEALQGSWVPQPVPLDVTRLSSVEFHVYTDATAPKPFDFCVTNLRAISF